VQWDAELQCSRAAECKRGSPQRHGHWDLLDLFLRRVDDDDSLDLAQVREIAIQVFITLRLDSALIGLLAAVEDLLYNL
jgi:hypothetical protein